MKKVLLTVLTIIGLTNVNAQKVEFGAKAGFNIATIIGDNTKGIESVTAFHFGVLSEIPISTKFSLQPEIMYSGQGYSFENNTIALSYLNIPLMGKYYVTKGLSVEAGPQIGFLLSAKNEDLNVKSSFKKEDFGFNFGVGYKLDNGLNFGARYNLGLTSMNKIYDVTNNNSVLQVSIGYFFLK